ncbi:hypothetical protein BGY98DRAFT_1012375 [Russula aff. rugulosa BPL654]|nr:hypothetical protein BGY98DRAFT_1012375 [Russula aff. rugulosa BPL654]
MALARICTYLFSMFSGRSRSILVTNSQSNMATHHLQTYARAMDSVIHVVRMAWKSNTGMEIGAAGWLAVAWYIQVRLRTGLIQFFGRRQ